MKNRSLAHRLGLAALAPIIEAFSAVNASPQSQTFEFPEKVPYGFLSSLGKMSLVVGKR